MAPEGQNRIAPSVLRMSAPLVISFWMRAAFAFVDTAYAATLGDAAVGAIGLTAPLEFLMIAIWVGLSTGLTSGLSQAMGACEGERVRQYLRTSWKLVSLASPMLALVGAGIWIYAPRLGLTTDLTWNFQVYGTVMLVGSSATAFWSIIPDSIIKAHQDTRTTMWAGIWSNLINVTLNTIFVFVFHWGIFGIALSTVLGRIGGLVYALRKAAQHEARRKEEGKDCQPGFDPAPYRTILALAIPSSLTFVLMAAETALINFLLSKTPHPTETIAAYSIFSRVVLFSLNPVIAVGVALLPYVAIRFGLGDFPGIRKGLREGGLATTAYSIAVVGPLMLLTAPTLAEWLSETPLTTEYATFALRLVPLACFLGGPFLLCRPVFEGMQRGTPGLVMATFRYVVLTAPVAWWGMRVAGDMDHPGLYGLIIGLLGVAALTSGAFLVWLIAALPSAHGKPLVSGASTNRIGT